MQKTVHSKGQIYVNLNDLISDSQGFWFASSAYPFILGASSIHMDEWGRTFLLEKGVRWICPYPDCGAINDDISNPICQHCKRSSV